MADATITAHHGVAFQTLKHGLFTVENLSQRHDEIASALMLTPDIESTVIIDERKALVIGPIVWPIEVASNALAWHERGVWRLGLDFDGAMATSAKLYRVRAINNLNGLIASLLYRRCHWRWLAALALAILRELATALASVYSHFVRLTSISQECGQSRAKRKEV